jgi:hypothetical protein
MNQSPFTKAIASGTIDMFCLGSGIQAGVNLETKKELTEKYLYNRYNIKIREELNTNPNITHITNLINDEEMKKLKNAHC